MTGDGTEHRPFAALGLQDLVLLAAWELADHGWGADALPLLRAAASLEPDLQVVAGLRARLLRDVVASIPVRPSLRLEIAQRLH